MTLLASLTSVSVLSSHEYIVLATKNNNDHLDQIQSGSQNSKCEAGEDNNNSCNNISISRQGGASNDNDDSGSGSGNIVQVSKQNSKCEA